MGSTPAQMLETGRLQKIPAEMIRSGEVAKLIMRTAARNDPCGASDILAEPVDREYPKMDVCMRAVG